MSTNKKVSTKTLKLDDGEYVVVDSDIYNFLHSYKWTSRRWRKCKYAVLTCGHKHPLNSIYMHRIIANTPQGQVCHHRNRNTLDNRRVNLMNMDPVEHRKLHQNNSLTIKFADSPQAESANS